MDNLLLVVLATVGIYMLIIFCLRITGKKGLSEMSVGDLVLIMLLSESFDVIVNEENKILGAVLSIVTLTAVNFLITWAVFKYKSVRKLVDGEPVLIIRNGKVLKRALTKERLSMDNVQEALRTHGVKDLSDVSIGMLEDDGKISIITNSK